jgi:hypothetical protein
MAKAIPSELGISKPPRPPKGYVVSDGVCDGEDFEASMKPHMGDLDSQITGAEIGEPTNQPGNPDGPVGADLFSPPKTMTGGKSSPSKDTGKPPGLPR